MEIVGEEVITVEIVGEEEVAMGAGTGGAVSTLGAATGEATGFVTPPSQ